MSIFFILSIACMTLFDFSGSGSLSISPKIVGLNCHDKPYLSLSQPHGPCSPLCFQSIQRIGFGPLARFASRLKPVLVTQLVDYGVDVNPDEFRRCERHVCSSQRLRRCSCGLCWKTSPEFHSWSGRRTYFL